MYSKHKYIVQNQKSWSYDIIIKNVNDIVTCVKVTEIDGCSDEFREVTVVTSQPLKELKKNVSFFRSLEEGVFCVK